jgi:hypothetical protein
LAGNGINGNSITFTTGQVADGDTPAGVMAVSPQNGAGGVPLNARITVQFSEAMSSVSMESNPIVLTQAGGGVVAGTIGISGDHTMMTFFPAGALAANTSYTVTVSGVADVSGNVAPAFASSFTTGTTVVTTRMSVASVAPTSGATAVPTTSTVTLTFNALVDPTTVNSGSVPVRISNTGVVLNGSYTVNGQVVTFTPSTALPVSTLISVTVNTNAVLDVVGNLVNGFSSSFTTGTQ